MTAAVLDFRIRYGEEMLAEVERIREFLGDLSSGPYEFGFAGRGSRNNVYLHFDDAEVGDAARCAWTVHEYLNSADEEQ